MYKIELTANNDRETLLKECYCENWIDTCKKIKKFQDLNMDILIRLYNEDMDHLGNFTNIKQEHPIPSQKKKYIKKIKLSTKIIILEILLSPLILLKQIIKEL